MKKFNPNLEIKPNIFYFLKSINGVYNPPLHVEYATKIDDSIFLPPIFRFILRLNGFKVFYVKPKEYRYCVFVFSKQNLKINDSFKWSQQAKNIWLIKKFF